MRIGVIGGGTVGRATARCWMEHAEVRVFDLDTARSTSPSVLHTLESDLVFVCLPEAAVEGFFAVLAEPNLRRNYVLKSTVPIGTTKRLAEKYGLTNLVHSPEFLTARCAVTDAQLPARNIIGRPTWVGSSSFPASPASYTLEEAYRKRFPGVPCLLMSSDESEAVKLMVNSFFAVKVALFNEFRALADRLGLDWEVLRAGVLSDGRIAHSHTQVPGHDGKRGFGGACLPKDLVQLVHTMDASGVQPTVCVAAATRNAFDRKEEVGS